MKKVTVVVALTLSLLGSFCSAEAKKKVLPRKTPKETKETAPPKKVFEIAPKPWAVERNKQYKICPGDSINIVVYGESDLSGDFEVRKDGTIKYPLLGSVKIDGLARREVENKLYQLLEQDYLVDPLVYVRLGTYSKRKIFILGCISNPGPYTFPEGKVITVLQAITEAGGLTRLASVGGVRVIRTGEGGKKLAINPRLNEIMKGRADDIKLEPNDMIVVPERLF